MIRWRSRRAPRVLSTSLVVLATSLFAPPLAHASHATPTVVDTSMGAVAGAQRELGITVDPNNADRLMAGANDRGSGGTGQRWFSSTDGGRTWTNGALPTGTLTLDGEPSPTMSDPSLDYGSNGDVYYSALLHDDNDDPCTLFVVNSTNQGTTWTNAANGVVRAGTQADDECNDKEHIAVDRANGDNVYVAWTPIGGPLHREAVFSRDLNGVSDGFAFSAPTVLSTATAQDGCLNQGADLALDPNAGVNGTIYVAVTSLCSGLANGDPGTVYVVRSTDLGATWSAPSAAATLDNANPNVDPNFRSRSHPSIDVDPTTGRVFVVYATNADASANTDPDVMIVSAPTGGTAWTAPVRVNQDAGTTEQVLPWIDVASGRIHVLFSSRANDGTNWNTHLARAAVSPTPAFTEITVNSAPTPPGTGFIGDYHGAYVGADDVLHPAWGDGRAGVTGATDAWTARVNFSPPTQVALSPLAPTEEVGTNLTFTATVTGSHGEAETFIPVTFTVTSAGSPSDSSESGVTDAAGQMQFTYTNTVAGTDALSAFADLDEDGTADAGETVQTTVTWSPGPPKTLDLTPATSTNTVDDTHTLTAHVEDRFGNDVPDIVVRFSVAGANGVFGEPTSGSDTTDANGDATFAYVGVMPGDDTITAFADYDEDGVRDPDPSDHEPQDTAAKTWVLPASTPGTVTGGGVIQPSGGGAATFGFVFEMAPDAAGPRGNLRYVDHGSPVRRVKATAVDALVITGPTGVKVFGIATVNGTGAYVFRLDLQDLAEPGVHIDTFRLRMSDGYDSGTATLRGGNIELH